MMILGGCDKRLNKGVSDFSVRSVVGKGRGRWKPVSDSFPSGIHR